MRIGIDLMGSDQAPQTLFEAVFELAASFSEPIQLVLFLTHEIALNLSARFGSDILQFPQKYPLDFCLTEEFISMDEDPLSAIRLKKKASLVTGIKQLASRQIDAFITAGNTGALIAAAAINLKPIGNCDRPALLAVLPTKQKPLVLVDAGGSVSVKAENLVDYAHLGAAYKRAVFGQQFPRVGLLNIGSEFKKGSIELQNAYLSLKAESTLIDSKMSFIGNVEPQEVYSGNIDVLITDGFTGNIFLKTSEAMASYVFDQMTPKTEQDKSENVKTRLKELQDSFDYEKRPGALVCGVDGIVIKCHGTGSISAIKESIYQAVSLLHTECLSKMRTELTRSGR